MSKEKKMRGSKAIKTNPTRTDFGGWIKDIADASSWRNARFQRAVRWLRDARADMAAEKAGWNA